MAAPNDSDLKSPADPAGVLLVQPRTPRLARQPWLLRLGRVAWAKVLLFAISITLFILAIILMQAGAYALAPFIRDTLTVNKPTNGLGFGWLSAYLVFSGSPIAAASLTFYASGIIDQLTAFYMITGSRLGASIIVLFLGFIYVLRGRDASTNLGMGLLTLSVTGSVYIVALPLGRYLLQSDIFAHWNLQTASMAGSLTSDLFAPAITIITGIFPDWILFLVGLAISLLSFNLFDRCLPYFSLRDSVLGRPSRLVYRPLIMFLLGAGITLISMSVSLSLGILIPLSNRGFVRRENVIPYIMGANITTFVDTLFASMLLGNSKAPIIVLAQMLSIAIVSIFLLLFRFYRFEQGLLCFVNWITSSRARMTMVMGFIFLLPALLLLA